jgi:glyoxylate reductase
VLDGSEADGLGEVVVRPIAEWDDRVLETADVIAVPASDQLPDELLDTASRCRLIAIFGTGTDGLSVDHATELGIPVANTPRIATVSVADLTMALLLAVARRLSHARELAERGRVVGPDQSLGFNLEGRVLGLVGFGEIGKLVAARARGFGMDAIYCRSRSPEASADPRHRSIDEVLERSDVVSLHTPLTTATAGLIDSAAIARMKRGAILINTARAGLLDEDALIAALESGQLDGAGLDVYADEPERPERLLSHGKIVLTAHVGGATSETRVRMAAGLLDILGAAARGELPATLVNTDVRDAPTLRIAQAA